MIKSKDLNICDACYIIHNYYNSLIKESFIKSDFFIDDDDDDGHDDDDDVNGYGKKRDVITDAKLEVQNIQYTKAKRNSLFSNLQIVQADDLKEIWKIKYSIQSHNMHEP